VARWVRCIANNVKAVKDRLSALAAAPPPELNPDTAPLGVEEDDDEYEPDFYAAEDSEQIMNKLDGSSSDLKAKAGDGFTLAPYKLPTAAPLTMEEALHRGRTALAILFGQMKGQETPPAKKAAKGGFNQFATGFGDRDASITLLTRLAARGSAGLSDIVPKSEGDDKMVAEALGNEVRDWLHAYVVDDFRKRIDIAVAWLCEEWYNDSVQRMRTAGDDVNGSISSPQHYEKLALKLLDGMLPYFHPQDRILTRFLGEIPQITPSILSRVKQMCRDPTLVSLALTSLLYVVMMKPPVQEIALDTIEAIWTECK
jgi:symplekin